MLKFFFKLYVVIFISHDAATQCLFWKIRSFVSL